MTKIDIIKRFYELQIDWNLIDKRGISEVCKIINEIKFNFEIAEGRQKDLFHKDFQAGLRFFEDEQGKYDFHGDDVIIFNHCIIHRQKSDLESFETVITIALVMTANEQFRSSKNLN